MTAGSCSSRLIFNVPKSRSIGGEFELGLTPNDHFDFSLSASYADSQIRSTIAGTPDLVASTGIREGNRLPSVPKFQAAVSATYQAGRRAGVPGLRHRDVQPRGLALHAARRPGGRASGR